MADSPFFFTADVTERVIVEVLLFNYGRLTVLLGCRR